ncbi:cytochrome P450 [Streptomyces sp. NBC_01218]|uniref:cytochrome P450 family protein n=1 Tax=unclassified Streptomyces TaxID=2593676 RepID=UPI0023B92B88|nr:MULTISPECIES: cytochrome P450 [unclassified Streptomyces]WEH39683.1 cytochrome P450 [Streptomyces sp. AM 2-1-1]WSQ51373.1 cytochrome P450 [Streptomyces sp. NBC_01218]
MHTNHGDALAVAPGTPSEHAAGPAARCPFRLDPDGTDIQGEAARIRAAGPATRIELPEGVPAWAVADPAVITRLLTSPAVSKDAAQHWPAWIDGEVGPDWSLALWVSIRSMFTAYGTAHTRLRKLVSGAFTAHRTKALAPVVSRIAEELLDEIEALPPGEPVDLRARYAGPLPARVICELFGVPLESRDRLCILFDALFSTATPAEEVRAHAVELYGILHALVALKRGAPGDDLTSALITIQRESIASGAPQPLEDQELLDTLVHFLSAGYETSINLIDHAVHALLTHPEQLELIRTGAAEWSDAVEETLRWEPAAANLMLRYAVEDIDLGEVVVPKGEALVMAVAGAGRDEGLHGPDAALFDLTRATRRDHLAFGYGVHHCLGAPLARMEGTTALSALFARFPELALAVPSSSLRPVKSFISNGHRELPVLRYGPGA